VNGFNILFLAKKFGKVEYWAKNTTTFLHLC
jgi:hypothetical protein